MQEIVVQSNKDVRYLYDMQYTDRHTKGVVNTP